MGVRERFERSFRDLIGARFAVNVSSGTVALQAMLECLPVRDNGGWVVTSPYSFPSTANAILWAGLRPCFVDIDPDSLLLDPVEVEKALEDLEPCVQAVLSPELFGRMDNVRELRALADRYDVIFLEDSCQALGSELDEYYAGTWGDAAAFSFYYTKNLPYGGGMVATRHEWMDRKIRLLRGHGMNGDGEMVALGSNWLPSYTEVWMGEQYIRCHGETVLANHEVSRPENHPDLYSRVIYRQPWYQGNMHRWKKLPCPNAERQAREVRG